MKHVIHWPKSRLRVGMCVWRFGGSTCLSSTRFLSFSLSLVLYFSLRRQRVIKYTHIQASLGLDAAMK